MRLYSLIRKIDIFTFPKKKEEKYKNKANYFKKSPTREQFFILKTPCQKIS